MELSFAAPALLYGLGAVSVPVIIHLLFRQRPRSAEFPALRFLRLGFRLQRTKVRLKHLLLLLLRILVVVLLALALSRPLLRSTLFAPAAYRSARVVLILDDSYSMGYRSDGTTTSLERAKAEADRLLGTLSLGSHAALLTTSRPMGEFTLDLDAVRRQIADLPLTPDDTPVWTALEAGAELGRLQPAELYLLTDMTRQAWAQARSVALELPGEAGLTVVDVGAPKARNLAVVDIDPPGTTTAQNRTLEFTATIRAQGTGGPRTLAFYLDGVRRANQPINLSGDERVSASFRHTFRTAGVHQGWVEVVEGDGLLADNARYFTVVVGRQPSLLMVNGDPGPGPDDELFFARLALNPGGFARAAPFRLEEVSPEELSAIGRLDEAYQVVLLANVARLPAETWAELGRFVLTGGGLAVFLGDRVDARNYATYGGDLLPGGVGPRVAFPGGARLVVPSFGHPLVAGFADGRNGDLSAPRFTDARGLTLFDRREVELVATFETGGEAGVGAPAVAVRRLGGGLVVCCSTALDDDWSDFPKWPAYLPFLHELTKFLSRSQAETHEFLVGEVARVRLGALPSAARARLSLRRPGDPVALPVAAVPTERTLVFTDTDRVGGYTIQTEGPDQRPQAVSGFSVNLNPAEGDLARVTPEELAEAVAGARVVRSMEELPAIWAKAGRGGTREVAPWLLAALLLAFVVETWFANRFYES